MRPGIFDPAPRSRGFTLLELLVAMAIFSFLGTVVVYLMRSGLGMFTEGTKAQQLQDRQEALMPQIQRDFQGIYVGDHFDPPPPEPDLKTRPDNYDPPPRIPVAVRLRAGPIAVSGLEGDVKGVPCPYFAFVIANAGEWADPVLRRAGGAADPTQAKVWAPSEEGAAQAGAVFQPTGGLLEVCYVSVPSDPTYPALLTLWRGWRGAVGGEGSLLDPVNLDSVEKIKKVCRPIQRGLIHFGATWRRVWSHNWDVDMRPLPGETEPYAGPVWDSTRGIEKTFPLFRNKESLVDPSDDVFPSNVALELTLVAPSAFGFGRGEALLVDPIADKDRVVTLSDVNPLLGPGAPDRWLKIGTEWMRTVLPGGVDLEKKEVRVDRGMRGTAPVPHQAKDWVYVGQAATTQIRLAAWRDKFAKKEDLLK